MIRIHYLLFVLLAGIGHSTCSAQSYGYQHYGIEDGLAGATVHGICQDNEGFIWFCTETGLSRFDGTHFKNYTRADGLPSNETFGVYKDHKGRIWISSFKNAACYYDKGKFYSPKNHPVLKKMRLSSEVNGFAESANGDMLLRAIQESYILTASDSVLPVYIGYSDKKTWTGEKHIFSWGLTALRISLVTLPDSMRRYMTDAYAYCSNNDRQPFSQKNSYVFRSADRIMCFFRNGMPHYEMSVPSTAKAIKCISDSVVSITDHILNGVKLYNIYTRKYIAEYLPDYTVNDIFEDVEGNLWFSTMGSGVYKLSPSTPQTYQFVQNRVVFQVNSIRKENGSICVGSSKGHYWKLQPRDNGMSNGPLYSIQHAVPDISQKGSQNTNPFIYCASSNFLKMENETGKRHINHSIKSVFLMDDTLVFATREGAYVVQRSDFRMIDTLHDGRTTCAYYQKGIIYIGTFNGLYSVDANHRKHYMGEVQRLFRNRISYFAESADGTLWIGTYEEGVIGYRDGKICANITQKTHGLSSDICRCLYVSGNTLWVGTEKGLNKIDLSNNAIRVVAKYTVDDGLNSDMINAVYEDEGRVFVGTPLGLTCFDESRMPKHSACRLQLTGLSVSGQQLAPDGPPLSLDRSDNNIRFSYAGISLLSMGHVYYCYRLLGLSNDWMLTTESALSYPSLPSGSYTLQLQAINKFGDRSAVLSRDFEIRPGFGERLWVRISALIVLIALVCVLIQYGIYTFRKKENTRRFTRQKMMELEQLALRAQMNPHFIFNCLNSIQHYIVRQDSRGANFYLSRFASLIRQTLDNSARLEVSLSEEIAYLSTYIELEQMQMTDGFRYTIVVDSRINSMEVMVPNMVIQAYVENAVKHGVGQLDGNGIITLEFILLATPARLQCIIEDNGPGIAAMRKRSRNHPSAHHSKGMSITYQRLEAYNQLYAGEKTILVNIEDLSHTDAPRSGTRVVLEFSL